MAIDHLERTVLGSREADLLELPALVQHGSRNLSSSLVEDADDEQEIRRAQESIAPRCFPRRHPQDAKRGAPGPRQPAEQVSLRCPNRSSALVPPDRPELHGEVRDDLGILPGKGMR